MYGQFKDVSGRRGFSGAKTSTSSGGVGSARDSKEESVDIVRL